LARSDWWNVPDNDSCIGAIEAWSSNFVPTVRICAISSLPLSNHTSAALSLSLPWSPSTKVIVAAVNAGPGTTVFLTLRVAPHAARTIVEAKAILTTNVRMISPPSLKRMRGSMADAAVEGRIRLRRP
jgi:hypothetical protein